MPKYPGASLLTAIVAYAAEHGRRPSVVWRDYLRHPSDYQLVFAWQGYVAKRREEELKKHKK